MEWLDELAASFRKGLAWNAGQSLRKAHAHEGTRLSKSVSGYRKIATRPVKLGIGINHYARAPRPEGEIMRKSPNTRITEKRLSTVTRHDALEAMTKSLNAKAITMQEYMKGEEYLNKGLTTPAEAIQSLIKRNRTMTASQIAKTPKRDDGLSNRVRQYREELRTQDENMSGVESDLAAREARNRAMTSWGMGFSGIL